MRLRGFSFVVLCFVVLFFGIFGFDSIVLSLSFQGNGVYLSLEDRGSKDSFKDIKEKEGSDVGLIERYIEKVKNPSEEYDIFMKKLLRSFFTGYGLRILVFFCVAMMIFFFFRTRNLFLTLLFYILGNLIMFFGHLIAKYIIK